MTATFSNDLLAAEEAAKISRDAQDVKNKRFLEESVQTLNSRIKEAAGNGDFEVEVKDFASESWYNVEALILHLRSAGYAVAHDDLSIDPDEYSAYSLVVSWRHKTS